MNTEIFQGLRQNLTVYIEIFHFLYKSFVLILCP